MTVVLGVMSGTPRLSVVVVATFIVLSTLILGTATAVSVLGMPGVVGSDHRVIDVNESTTVVESTLRVRNPAPFPVRVDRATITYAVLLNGIPVGSGQQSGVSLAPGISTVDVTTRFQNERLTDWWTTHVRRGERSNLTLVATVHSPRLNRSFTRQVSQRPVNTDLISVFETTETVPIKSSPVVSGPVLYVNETTANWTMATRNRTAVRMQLGVYNPHSYTVPVTAVRYDVGLNDVAVATGSTNTVTTIEPRTHRTLTAGLVIDNSKLTDWWVSHIQRNQTTTVTVEYAVTLNFSAYGGRTRTISPDPRTRTFRTAVFETTPRSQSSSAASNRSMRSVLPT